MTEIFLIISQSYFGLKSLGIKHLNNMNYFYDTFMVLYVNSHSLSLHRKAPLRKKNPFYGRNDDRSFIFRRNISLWFGKHEEAKWLAASSEKMEDLTCIAQRGIFIQGYQRRVQENFVVIFRYDTMIRGLNPWLVLIYCWGE